MERRTIKQLVAKLPKQKKKGWWKKWLVLIPLLLILAGVVYVVNLPKYQIEQVKVEGLTLTREADVQSIAQKELSGKYLFVIPRSFVWLFPRSAIREKVEALSSVLSASLDLDQSSQTLTINIEERKQEYVWCTDGAPKDCYYMDKDGLIFIKAPEFEGNVFLTFKGLADQSSPIGTSFLPKDKMTDLLTFIGRLRTLGLPVVSIRATSIRDIHLALSSGTDIIITLESSLEDVARSIETLANSEDFKSASGGISELEYIDLRYGAKAFWK
jgi:cell division septal protein FtsQ